MPKDKPAFNETAMFAELEAEGLALIAELAAMPMPELPPMELQDIDFSAPPPDAPKRACKAPKRARRASGSERISIRIPARVLIAYRDAADRQSCGYQTLINKVLKSNMPE